MNRLTLFRLISVIHAVKCNKSSVEADANVSFNKLIELKNTLANATEGQFVTIHQASMTWAAEVPIATDREINELLNHN